MLVAVVLVAGGLTFGKRAEIARRHDRREGVRGIGRALGRAPSAVSRELARNISPSPRRHRAFPARIMARERARRRSRAGSHTGRTGIAGVISVRGRPAGAGDRAVPGHWEGGLITGGNHASAVAALAGRASRFCLLIALPDALPAA